MMGLFASPTFRTRRFIASSAVIATVALAGCGGNSSSAPQPAATPASWRLNAGAQSQQNALQGLAYYPKTITIDAGDTVTWTFASGEPHTVTFLGAGQATPPPPSDPTAPRPAGGPSYDGSTYTSSGFIAGGFGYSLTFTKAGTYTYYCLIHQPEMEGVVVVQPAGTPYPSTEDGYSTQAVAQSQADLNAAAAAVSLFPFASAGTHLAAGIATGLFGAAPATSTVMRFLDDTNVGDTTVTVPVGTTVTWTNESNNAPHTVTFPIAGQPLPALPGDPFTPPIGGSTYDGSALVNSGVIAPGQSYALTFTKAGTFQYYCLFHDTEGMQGTVVVQ